MKKNLTARTVVIVATILICIFGIVGIPKSKADLVKNFDDNIRLGLDLKGGSHLVLQVQVQDAVKADADQTIERLKEDLKKQNITWADMQSNDAKTVDDADKVQINIKGVPRDAVERFPQPGGRALSHLYPDGRELHRLHDEAQALRADRAGERYRDAQHRYHRQPHRPTRPGREDGDSSTALHPITKFWCSCRAWTIPPA